MLKLTQEIPHEKNVFIELFQSISTNLEWMSIESAEMTKHAINSFLANSVVFINELSTICPILMKHRSRKTEKNIPCLC